MGGARQARRPSSFHHMRTTRWNDSRRPSASASATTMTALAKCVPISPVPSGWELRMASSRRTYFVDHNTCTTVWDDLGCSRRSTRTPCSVRVTSGGVGYVLDLVVFHHQFLDALCQVSIRWSSTRRCSSWPWSFCRLMPLCQVRSMRRYPCPKTTLVSTSSLSSSLPAPHRT
ncbi:hypothetical protein BJY52DRAFT_425748 [Lactarius psammicola]|nr:hypothetical protein BJY52DRAFT_425748 [Lactarius psammicola]